MANEIVQFTAESGEMVTITPNDIVQYLCPQATEKEVFMFLELCKAHKLNPWIGDVYLIKYGDNPAQMQAGKEAFTKRAAANPDFEGFEAGITYADAQGRIRQREGSAYYSQMGELLIGGWARVHVRGKKPFYDEVTRDEYDTGRNLWKSKPATMVRKVALVHALREAFPDDFAGLYSEEEMPDGPQAAPKAKRTHRAEDAPNHPKPKEVAAQVAAVDDVPTPASAADCETIGNMINELAELRQADYKIVYDAVFSSAALVAAGFDENGDLNDKQAKAAIKQLERWIQSAKAKAAQAETLPDMPEYETE